MDQPSLWELVPRLELRLGRWRFPAWTALGRVGAVAGVITFAVTTRLAGVETLVISAVTAACVGSFLAWRAVGRRWRSGRYVLLEFALLACGATIGVTAALGAPISTVLDRWVVALAVCLGIGRLGCLCHGCCHGQAARRGLRYRWLVGWYPGGPWETLRVFPLQAVEAGVLAMLAVTGAWLSVLAPGTAASFLPAGYSVARLELERWRGDARRYLGPLSHNQWWCIVVVAAVGVIGDWRIGVTGLAIIAVVLTVHRHRLAPGLVLSSPSAVAAFERAVERGLSGETTRVGGIVIEALSGGVRVQPGTSSMSHEAARALTAVIKGRMASRRGSAERSPRDLE